MTTKLVSLNIGCRLTVQDEQGNQHEYEWSAICPSKDVPQPFYAVSHLETFLEEKLELQYELRNENVQIAKPTKLKPAHPTSHKSFNRRVKKNLQELGYKD